MTPILTKGKGNFHYYNPKQDVGDYIEAEFVSDLGVVDHFAGSQVPVPVFGFLLLVTLSANNEEPKLVEFRIASYRNSTLFRGREPGEKLILKSLLMKKRHYEWYDLIVNGEMATLDGGRVKV